MHHSVKQLRQELETARIPGGIYTARPLGAVERTVEDSTAAPGVGEDAEMAA